MLAIVRRAAGLKIEALFMAFCLHPKKNSLLGPVCGPVRLMQPIYKSVRIGLVISIIIKFNAAMSVFTGSRKDSRAAVTSYPR